jgi:murein DD-endopeptidase MepM/ murein hydrolase activator NlpD
MVNVKVSNMRIRVVIALCLAITSIPSANAAPNYAFPIVGCTYQYSRYHHDYPATDILAKKGCKFVAVTSGVVDEIRKTDTYNYKKPTPLTKGGIFISLVGDDGVRYYASHLQKIIAGIEVGTRVEVGDLLGFVGDTGDARGTSPHVHFGISWPTADRDIWWVRRGVIFPWRYLDKWKVGGDRSPAAEVKALLLKTGELPPIPKK